jgi:hypothetical protein
MRELLMWDETRNRSCIDDHQRTRTERHIERMDISGTCKKSLSKQSLLILKFEDETER